MKRLYHLYHYFIHLVNIIKKRDSEYLKHLLRRMIGSKKGRKKEDKLNVYQYVQEVLAVRDKTAREENAWKAICNFQQGKPLIDSLPVILEYDMTHSGCNIIPSCGKCYIAPGRKLSYNFANNEFKGLETALSHSDAVFLGSTFEITLDKNYPAIADSMMTAGVPRLCHPTNGILLKHHVKNIVGKVRSILISLDAHTPDLYAKLQSNAKHFNLIIAGINELAEAKRKMGTKYPNIFLSFTLSKENAGTINDYYEYFLNSDCTIDVILLNQLTKATIKNPGRVRGNFIFDFVEQMLPPSRYFEIVKDMKKFSHSQHSKRFQRLQLLQLLQLSQHLQHSQLSQISQLSQLSHRKAIHLFEMIDYLSFYPLIGKDYLLDLEGPVCPWPWLCMKLNIHGWIKLCNYSNCIVGNWRHQGVDAVWKGKKMVQIRSQIARYGVAPECLDGLCPIIHKLGYLLYQKGVRGFLDQLKKNWTENAPLLRPLIKDVIKETAREKSLFFDKQNTIKR